MKKIISIFILACLILSAKGQTTVTIGAGTFESGQQPVGAYYGYTRSASIYTSSEIGSTGVIITSLQWYVRASSTTVVPFKIYLKSTSATTTGADTWANYISGATKVYDNTASPAAVFTSTGWITVDITDYMYTTGNNLLVLVETNYGGSGAASYPTFNTTNAGAWRTWVKDGTPPTTETGVTTISPLAYRPNIKITHINQTTWTGTTNTDWNTANNWSNGVVPTSTISVTIPNVTNQPTISASTAAACLNLTINSGATLTIGTILTSSGSFHIHGNITNNGTLKQTGDVQNYLYGSSKTIDGSGSFHFDTSNPVALNIATGASYSLAHDIQVFQITFQTGTTFNLGSYKLSTRSFTLSAGATFNANSGTLELGKTTNVFSGTFNCGTGTVYYNTGDPIWVGYNSYSQTIQSVTYNNLKIRTNNGYTATIGSGSDFIVNGDLTIVNPSTSGGIATTANNISLNGNLSLGEGSDYGVTFNIGHRIARTTASGSGIFAMNNDLSTTDNNTINITYSSATQCAIALGASGANTSLTFYGKVNYNSNSNQLVMGPNIKNIEFLGTGTKTLSCDLNVEKDLTLTQGTLDVGTGTTSYSSSASNTCGGSTEVAGTPFNPKPSDNKVQYLFTASELLSFGLSANSEITKTSYYVCGYDAVNYTYHNFTAKLGHTSTANLNSGPMASPSMTTVFTPSSLTVSGNGNIDINFTTPFVWDGTSNLVVEYCFDNCDDASCFDFLRGLQEVYVDPSSTPNYFSAQDHSLTGVDMCASTTVTNRSYKRPKTSFTATAQRTIYLAGNWINHTSNTIDFTYRQSTVYFDGSTTQLINQNGRNIDFYNVVVDGSDVRFYNSGSNASSQNVSINNNLTINTSKNFKLYDPTASSSNGSITVSGNLINNGTISGTNYKQNTVDNAYFSMSGSSKTISGSGAYTNFYMQSDGTISITSNNLSIAAAKVSSSKTLTLNDGLTLATTNDLTVIGTYTANNSTTTEIGRDALISGGIITLTNTATDPIFKIGRNWNNTGTFNYNESTVIFNSANNSNLDGNSLQEFYKFEINKTTPSYYLTLNQNILIKNQLNLQNGVIYSLTNKLLSISDNATSNEGNAGSFIDGPILKEGNDSFVFPVGDDGKWSPMGIESLVNQAVTDKWTATYHKLAPSDGYNYEYPPIDHISTNEYWELEKTAGASNLTCKAKLFWKDASFSGIINETELLVAHYFNNSGTTKWWNEGSNSYSSGISGWILSNQLTSNGLLSFASTTLGNPLPIELSSFSAICSYPLIDLKWSTLSEINNNYFKIECSQDMQNWTNVSVINGVGNSNTITNYQTSISEKYNNNYCRLSQVDFDGSLNNCGVLYLSCIDDAPSYEVIAVTQSESGINISFNSSTEETINIQIFDPIGKLIFCKSNQKLLNGNNNIFCPFNIKSSAIYLINTFNEKQQILTKYWVK